jgi:hypothetical protein
MDKKICESINCKRTAKYNFPDQTVGKYCSKHKLDGMYLLTKKCKFIGCITDASCGYIGKKVEYCGKHKLDGMFLQTRFCETENCHKRAYFNDKGQTVGKFCGEHMTKDMINVFVKYCEKCNKEAMYNFKGQKKGKYCFEHKEADMINVRFKLCEREGCLTTPSFNFAGLKAKFCSLHKEDGMINLRNRLCKDCDTVASFNFKGKLPEYCNKHKLEGMIEVTKKLCIYDKCNLHPCFNFTNTKTPIYCSKHKLEGMVDKVNGTCITPLCGGYPNKKCDGYCLFCYTHLFPDKPISQHYRTKEKTTSDHVIQMFPIYTWIKDKKIFDGCSRRRPDLILDLGYQIIIVETDENQHNDYECSCENKRLVELSKDVGFRSIIFIRFNPDSYYDGDNLVKSCWKVHKNGICVIDNQKIDEWNERLRNLDEQIKYWCNEDNKTDKMIEIVQLYYDRKPINENIIDESLDESTSDKPINKNIIVKPINESIIEKPINENIIDEQKVGKIKNINKKKK